VIAHWDEVDEHRRHAGHIQGVWQDLGRAAGSVTVGVKRIRVPPGGWSTPAHIHGRDEEIFYVLAGSGLSWQGAKTYEVGPGDAIVHLANGEPHTVYGGDQGIDLLAFGMRERDEAAYLPRAGVLWLGAHYVDAADAERTPWRREEGVGPPDLPAPSERPPSIVNVAELTGSVDRPPGYTALWRDLGRTAGSVQTGIKHVTIEPGNLSAPPHVHSAEEEIFVVLEGEGTLVLIPGDEVPVRAGHVVSRPAGTRVAHAFRAGKTALTLLAYGTREPSDVAYYPRSNKVYFRGTGLIARVEPLDYWDGE
jgi:uncharacterized cupin superfamily protein